MWQRPQNDEASCNGSRRGCALDGNSTKSPVSYSAQAWDEPVSDVVRLDAARRTTGPAEVLG